MRPARATARGADEFEQKFLTHVQEVYLQPNGKDIHRLLPKQLAVYLGYALGRQAPFARGNPEYQRTLNSLHDKLMAFLDQSARDSSSESGVPYEQLQRECRELAEAAFAGYADEQVKQAIRVPQRIPSLFAPGRFSLRDIGLAGIAGPYIIKPVGFAGEKYEVRLLTDRHAAGYLLTGGAAAAWTFTETKIWFHDARGNVTWQFDWAGDGGFKGYPVFLNIPDTAREYRMDRSDGVALPVEGTEDADRGSDSGGRGFTQWLKPVNDPDFAARIARGMGARDRSATPRAGDGDASGETVVIPSDALDPEYITAHINELVGYVKSRNLDGIRAAITDDLADFFDRTGKKVLTDAPLPEGSLEDLARRLIPKVAVIVDGVKIDAGNKTAEVTVSLGPASFRSFAVGNNKIFLEWTGSARGDWKVREFKISPEIEELKTLLILF